MTPTEATDLHSTYDFLEYPIEDCDDTNPNSTMVTEDYDCDGIPTESDCNDSLGDDNDCDGVINIFECDSEDPSIGTNLGDVNCDGILDANDPDRDNDTILREEDCDDFDENVTITIDDEECPSCLENPFEPDAAFFELTTGINGNELIEYSVKYTLLNRNNSVLI